MQPPGTRTPAPATPASPPARPRHPSRLQTRSPHPARLHPLDNPVRSSLTGPHARFAEQRGRILRYPVDVTPWLALPDAPDAPDWADAAALAGPGGSVTLTAFREPPPQDWEIVFRAEGVQLVDVSVSAM